MKFNFDSTGEFFGTSITKFARFGGGGYQGPSAAELEAQAQADFERQQMLLEEQRRIAREEREYQKQLEEEAKAAEEERLAKEEADRKAREEAADLAASEEAAVARDVEYDPQSGSVLSLLREDVQIPDSDESQ